MRNITYLRAGDRVTLTVRKPLERTYDAVFLGSDHTGFVIRSRAPMHTEHRVPWSDPDIWISDPTTGEAYAPVPAEESLVGDAPELE